MSDYAVTVTLQLLEPMPDEQGDAVMDLLPDDAAMGVSDVEVSVTVSAAAAGPLEAGSLIEHLVRSVVAEAGGSVGRLVEVEVLEWDRHAARVEVPV